MKSKIVLFLVLSIPGFVGVAEAQEFLISQDEVLVTSESGGSDAFSVRLSRQPAADVLLPIEVSDPTEATVSPGQLRFTPANWNLGQAVVARGLDDTLIDGNVEYVLRLGPATSADPAWNGIDPPDLEALNLDNDESTDLALTKKATTAQARVGERILFEITVTNRGTVSPLDVVVEDELPVGTALIENTGDCVTAFPCQIGRIDPGETKTIQSSYAVLTAREGRVINTATVTSEAPDPDPSNDSETAVVELCPTVPKNPSPASLTSAPRNGVLSWTSSGADRYLVYLGPDRRGCNLLLGETSETSLAYSGLVPGTLYEWRVVAIKKGCPEQPSSCIDFMVEENVCDQTPPELTSPENGAVLFAPVELAWTPVEEALEYRLYAGPSPDDLRLVRTIFRELTRVEESRLPVGDVYWRIEAILELCPPVSSETRYFELDTRRRRGARRH